MYPYAWATVDVEITTNYAKECIPAFEASSEIICVTL